MPDLSIVNIGTEVEPKYRLKLEDYFVGLAGTRPELLHPLKEELEQDPEKRRVLLAILRYQENRGFVDP